MAPPISSPAFLLPTFSPTRTFPSSPHITACASRPSPPVHSSPKKPRSTWPPPPPTSESLRVAAGKLDDIDEAEELYRRATMQNPRNGRAWQDWATKLSQYDLRAAERVLHDALRYNGENAYLWQSLAVMNVKQGKLDKARVYCQRGLDCDATHVSLYGTWAQIEARQRNYTKARELYEEAENGGHAGAKLYHMWATMELRLGNEGRAVELCQRGLKVDAVNGYLWKTLGVVARERGDVNKARMCFERAEGVVAMEEWAKLEAGLGNWKVARELFERGVTSAPGDARVLHAWALFEMQRGCLERARGLIRRAIAICGEDSILWCCYAKIEAALGYFPKARALYKKACQVNPGDWLAWDQWSAMELNLGNRTEAEKLLHESFRIRFNAKGDFTILANNINDRKRQ